MQASFPEFAWLYGEIDPSQEHDESTPILTSQTENNQSSSQLYSVIPHVNYTRQEQEEINLLNITSINRRPPSLQSYQQKFQKLHSDFDIFWGNRLSQDQNIHNTRLSQSNRI